MKNFATESDSSDNIQTEDKRIYILSKEKPSKAVLKMGLPLIAGMFIMVLYNLVDTYFIGLTRNDYQLAAVNLAYPVMMVAIAVSLLTKIIKREQATRLATDADIKD